VQVPGLSEAVADDVLEFIADRGQGAALVKKGTVEGGSGEAVGGRVVWDEEGGH